MCVLVDGAQGLFWLSFIGAGNCFWRIADRHTDWELVSYTGTEFSEFFKENCSQFAFSVSRDDIQNHAKSDAGNPAR